ncbi:Membrane associated serine protease, rhomboid family [Acetitomaculum ruminis DSM 5522]|uniref:Membrane associated serine protease, rhomboid family n=1 Tax=Acetitomaculum ruminis DSM 5522 TaxID=1120918 RepID=A0A1I0ZFR1_9FIRM|nr:rhomboid family intramembrane serine protease [Acetitomaculum ruminis]SFB23238.1 Membrane associated serine protease, rhomboid family [Acetitomaculum ruminis DSM 5522]
MDFFKLHQVMHENLYSSVKTNLHQISVYYRKFGPQIDVAVLMDCQKGEEYTKEQLEIINKKIINIFRDEEDNTLPIEYDRQNTDVDILYMVAADDALSMRQKLPQNIKYWLIDGIKHRLLIFDDQPSEFGLFDEEFTTDNPWIKPRPLKKQIKNAVEFEDNPLEDAEKVEVIIPVRRKVSFPVINVMIILINIGIFALLEYLGNTTESDFMLSHGAMYPPYVLMEHRYYLLFTSMFVHFGIDHMLNNMFILYFIGDILERTYGKIKFLMIYILGGIGGNVISLYAAYKSGENAVSGGASGAIFSVIGALLYVTIINKGKIRELSVLRMTFMIALSLLIGFTSDGVDNVAHLGGLLCGIILAAVLCRPLGNKKYDNTKERLKL